MSRSGTAGSYIALWLVLRNLHSVLHSGFVSLSSYEPEKSGREPGCSSLRNSVGCEEPSPGDSLRQSCRFGGLELRVGLEAVGLMLRQWRQSSAIRPV